MAVVFVIMMELTWVKLSFMPYLQWLQHGLITYVATYHMQAPVDLARYSAHILIVNKTEVSMAAMKVKWGAHDPTY